MKRESQSLVKVMKETFTQMRECLQGLKREKGKGMAISIFNRSLGLGDHRSVLGYLCS